MLNKINISLQWLKNINNSVLPFEKDINFPFYLVLNGYLWKESCKYHNIKLFSAQKEHVNVLYVM